MQFGSTGHMSTRTLFGAAALGSRSQADADRTMELLLEKGVNHIDTAADYGESELRLGPWMKRYRDRFFLATKTQGRTYDGARESLHRSLDRLQTDHVDLLQMHILVNEDEWQTAFGPGGALEYLVEAKNEGLVRSIGVTGHGLSVARMHMRSLDRYAFDSVLLPWNYPMSKNKQYAAEFEALSERCSHSGVAVQTIKSIARGPWGEKEKTRDTWYEPLEAQADIDRAVWWLLSHASLFLNTVGDIDLLPRVIDAAERFDGSRPSDDEMDALMRGSQLEPLFVE
jgi:aryl-alcohol dehydrogenase-like predicted oxidoreductase